MYTWKAHPEAPIFHLHVDFDTGPKVPSLQQTNVGCSNSVLATFTNCVNNIICLQQTHIGCLHNAHTRFCNRCSFQFYNVSIKLINNRDCLWFLTFIFEIWFCWFIFGIKLFIHAAILCWFWIQSYEVKGVQCSPAPLQGPKARSSDWCTPKHPNS